MVRYWGLLLCEIGRVISKTDLFPDFLPIYCLYVSFNVYIVVFCTYGDLLIQRHCTFLDKKGIEGHSVWVIRGVFLLREILRRPL